MAYTNNAMKIEDDFNRVDPTSTNESVAYDLSRFDRRRIVREAVRQDDETEKKPVRRPMPRAKISYLTILFYFIVAAVAASMLISYVSLFELTVNTAARKDELEVLRNENIRLNADMEKRYNLGDIETYATDTLGMI
ncbi:MAG: hypothetical protein GX633_08980, partial [Clostridiales bacterium]|nr:hypothetical protein [Clostridiales bacterium]